MTTRVIDQSVPIPVVPPNPSSRGKTIFDTAEGAFRNIQKICTLYENAHAQPARAGNAFLSCFAGANLVFSGNWILGLSCLTLGGREIFNLTKNSEDPVKILEGITADVETIGLLARSQEEHLSSIKEKLDTIKSDVVALHANLDEIRVLNESGIKEISSHQIQARTLNEKAIKTYAHSEESFAKAQNATQEAQTLFDRSSRYFAEIVEMAKNPQPDVEAIRAKATEALVSCNEGRVKLNAAESAYLEAFGIFHQAYALKTQSFTEVVVATVKAKEIMKSSAEKAKYNEEFQRKWNALAQKIEELEVDVREILRLVDDLREQLKEADEAMRQKYDFSDLFVGVASALVALQASGFLIPAGIVGLSAGSLWHWTDGSTRTAQGVDQLFFGDSFGSVPFLRKGEFFCAQFDKISSGKWGAYVQRRPSETVGSILLNLDGSLEGGAHPAAVRFHLGDKVQVSKLSQLKLFSRICEDIQTGKTHPQHALDMLELLTAPKKIKGSEKTIQIFKKDSFYVRRIEALCKKKLGI